MSTRTNTTESATLAVSAKVVAQLLSVSERHVWAMHASGELGPEPIAMRTAKRWYVQELQDWLSAGGPPRTEWRLLRAHYGHGYRKYSPPLNESTGEA